MDYEIGKDIKDKILAELKDDFIKNLHDKIKEELVAEFKVDFDNQWENSLLSEIKSHENGLIIRSPPWTSGYTAETFYNFCFQLFLFS